MAVGRSTSLTIEVLTDSSKATRGLQQVATKTDGLAGSLGKKLGGLAIGAGILKFGSDSIKAAAQAEQAIGGVRAVFKTQSGAIEKAAEGAAKSIGLSSSAYENLATLLGSQLKTAGFDDVAGKTQELITLGGDLAAMYGGTTSDAVSAISSLMKGERDPIEKYGVAMNQAAIDAEVMALGLDTSTTAAKRQAQAQASLSLLYKQTADAQGAAAREQDSASARYQQFLATVENLEAAVGSALLPAMSGLAEAAMNAAPFVQAVGEALSGTLAFVLDMPGPVLALVAALGGLVALKGPLGAFGQAFADTVGAGARQRIGLIEATGGKISKVGAYAREGAASLKVLGGNLLDTFGGAPGIAVAAFTALASKLPDLFGKITDSIPDSEQSGLWVPETDLGNMLDQQADLVASLEADAKARDESAAAESKRVAALDEGARATALAAKGSKLWEDALKSAGDEAKSLAENTELATRLADSAAQAENAARALNLFSDSVSKVDGQSRSFVETQVGLGESMGDVAALFAQSGDDPAQWGAAVQVGAAALADFNVATLSTSAAGQDVVTTLLAMKDAHVANYSAAYSDAAATGDVAAAQDAARKAASDNYAALVKQISGFVGSDEAAEELLAQLGILDGKQIDNKDFQVIAKDADARKKLTEINNIKLQEKRFDVMINDLASRGITQINDTQIDPKTGVVTMTVDDGKVVRYSAPDKEGKVTYIPVFDWSKVDTRVPDYARPKATLSAAAPAPSGFAGVRSLSAVDPNAIDAPALLADDAPDVMAPVLITPTLGARSPVTNVTYNITVNGAVDKDGTAREIQSLLRTRDRRSGSVTIGGRAA